jgi:FAD-dependent urate hydroxylase
MTYAPLQKADGVATLEELTARARADLAYVDNPAREWPPVPTAADSLDVVNVVVAGGGINGLAAAFALMRQKIGKILVVDDSPPGREGPWVKFARMRALRTAKEMVGPDLGFPSLSFPAWYVARFGENAWRALDKAPNDVWMDYLGWFRRTAGIPVHNNTRLTAVAPGPFGLRLSFAGCSDLHARQLVFATGVLGSGGPSVPSIIAALPRSHWAHSADEIDFAVLQGCTVVVIGAGASAFDNAACALEAGAARVLLLARRDRIEQPDVKSAMHFAGCLSHYSDLSDDQRIRLINALNAVSVPPPLLSVERCTLHGDRFSILTRAPILSARMVNDGRIEVGTPQGAIGADYIIAATGFSARVHERPELGELGRAVELWRDHVPATAGMPSVGDLPYLGRSFEYRSKDPALQPVLSRIRELGMASMASMGPVCTGLGGIKFGAPGAVEGISRDLFLEQAEEIVTQVEGVARTAVPVNEPQFV